MPCGEDGEGERVRRSGHAARGGAEKLVYTRRECSSCGRRLYMLERKYGGPRYRCACGGSFFRNRGTILKITTWMKARSKNG